MTRISERSTVTSEAIPDVGLTLLASGGYHGTALSHITEALELRIPSLYNHRHPKHSLLTAPSPGRRYPGCAHRLRLIPLRRFHP